MRQEQGFSLTELLVAMAVTTMLASMMFHLFHQNERVMRDQTLIMEMQQTARIVASQIADEVPSGGRVDSATVYVLVCPGERVYVFRALQSPQMEEVIGRFPRGSVLHYHTHGLMKPPSQAQLGALTAFCKSKGISLSGPYSIN